MCRIADPHVLQEQTRRAERIAHAAARLTHEFKNVLMGFSVTIRNLERSHAGDPVIQKLTDLMKGSIEHGKRVAQDMDRVASPRKLSPRPIDLAKWLSGVCEDSGRMLAPSVQIVLSVDPNVAEVSVDDAALDEAIRNLLLNAYDAMPNGGTTTVGAERCSCSGASQLHIWVTDQGGGMTAEVAECMFDPYFTTRTGRAGLGLAVAHQVVTAHGGHIYADTAPGRETTIHVRLPV